MRAAKASTTTMVALLTAAAPAAVPVWATAASGSVHVTMPSSTWKRTLCGSPANAAPPNSTDIITSWGARVKPDNVKTLFGYPRRVPAALRPHNKPHTPHAARRGRRTPHAARRTLHRGQFA